MFVQKRLCISQTFIKTTCQKESSGRIAPEAPTRLINGYLPQSTTAVEPPGCIAVEPTTEVSPVARPHRTAIVHGAEAPRVAANGFPCIAMVNATHVAVVDST